MTSFFPHRSVLAALAATAVLALACRFSPGQGTPTPTEPGFLPLTSVAQVTPPPPERRPCAVPANSPSLPSLEDPLQAAPQILTFLNQGGDPLRLVEGRPTAALARPDLDGDSWVDLAFAVQESAEGGLMVRGTLLVYRCQENAYQLIYASPERADVSAPTIHSDADLNLDDHDDLLVSRRSCGAHTCVAEAQVLMWGEGTLNDRMQGGTDDLPSPTIEVQQGDQGQPARIAITATGINSAGAGPFRPVTRIWTWDEQSGSYQPSSERLHEPEFRVHVLHDADSAAREGNLERAIEGYRRVIQDEDLRDWFDPARERAVLSGFARYRIIAVQLRMDRPQEARSVLDELRASTSPDGPGGPYAELAEVFWDEFQRSNDLSAACRVAAQYAAAHRGEILDPLTFGYANPSYAPEDMCRLSPE